MKEQMDPESLHSLFERLGRLSSTPADLLAHGVQDVLGGSLSLESFLRDVLDQAIIQCSARRGFALISADRGRYRFLVSRGEGCRDLDEPDTLVSRGIIEQVLESQRPVFCRDASADPRFSRHTSVRRLALHSLLCLPLVWRGQTIGAIYLDHSGAAGRFGEREHVFAEELARKAVTVLGLLFTVQNYQSVLDGLRREVDWLQSRTFPASGGSAIIGASKSLRSLKQEAGDVAQSELAVLLLGETGTGKELFARWIHDCSPRRAEPFVAINCATIPEASLAESELFGHARDAYTGAASPRGGRIEQANGGTLFLDEIGDMPLAVQAKLLRLLESGEYFRLGEDKPRRANVRVLAATNKDLDELMSRGAFRKDFYFRLSQYTLCLPPLRERPEDIEPIADYILAQCNAGIPPRLERSALDLLRAHPWLGNVRELGNVLRRCLVGLERGASIGAERLRPHLSSTNAPQSPFPAPASSDVLPSYREAQRGFERDYFARALSQSGHLSRAELAERLGMPLRTLHHKLRELGLR